MIKRMLCLCMILAMLTSACTAMADSADAVQPLLAQLDAYLSCTEALLAIRAGVISYAQAFCDQPSYASLLSARIASDQAQGQLAALSVPELSLSESELLALLSMGVETDALEIELNKLSTSLSAAFDKMNQYELLLNQVLLQHGTLESFAEWVALDRQRLALDAQYEGFLINVLLLPVANQEAALTFWQTLAQRYPVIGGYQGAWESNGDTLISDTAQLLDEYTELTSRASKVLGQDSYSTDQFVQHVQDGDLDALKADAVILEDMPAMAPLPSDWLEPETSYYSISSESDGAIPETLTHWDTNVSLDAFQRYLRQLLDYGATLYQQEGSDETGLSYALIVADHVLVLNWYPICAAVVGYQPAFLTLEPYAYILCCS